MAMDHCVPLITLMIEYIMCSSTPFIPRQYSLMLIILLAYLTLNITWVKVTGHFIYPPMTWDNVAQFFYIPIGFLFAFTLFETALFFLTRKKLYCQGNESLVAEVHGQSVPAPLGKVEENSGYKVKRVSANAMDDSLMNHTSNSISDPVLSCM